MFNLKMGDKFSCIAFENIAADDSLDIAVDLGDGLWALPAPPFALNDRWQKWVGSHKSGLIARCNLFLVATLPSKKPHDLDAENQLLSHRADLLFYGLLLQGLPDHLAAYSLTGARQEDEVEVRSMGNVRDHFHSHPKERVMIKEATCHMAKRFLDGFVGIEESKDFDRFKRGIRSVIRGIREANVEDRIHEYVRALEALVKPGIGASTRQFAHRCLTFSGASEEARHILDDGYDIRSAVEHMHSMDVALQDYPEGERDAVGFTRLRQLEALVFGVYLRAVTSSAHSGIFRSDADIDAFWGLRDDERQRLWGAPVNIAGIS